MNNQPNLKTFLIALVLALGLLVPYEYYWRHVKHWGPGHDLENLDIWADQRSKVEDMGSDNIIIMAHNFGPQIAQSLINDGYKGRLITMLPEIESRNLCINAE